MITINLKKDNIMGTFKTKSLKGVAPLVSTIMIVGVIAAITGVAYQWGMPMMQKNVGKTELYASETLLRTLDNQIDNVAKNGGSEEILFNLPGELQVNAEEDMIVFSIETSGSVYAAGGFICFSRNCDLNEGVWGEDPYSVIGARVSQSDENYAQTNYILQFRNLTDGDMTYHRDIVTPDNVTLVGSEGSRLLVTKIGESRGDDTVETIIKIDRI